MFRSFKRACLWLALICLLSGMRAALGEMAAPPSPGDAASGDAAGGLDASSGVTVLFLNSRERHVCAEGLRTYAFTCPRDGNYVFCGLRDQGDAGSVSVVLRGEGRIMGSGRLEDIFSLPAALREGETYTLAVNGGDAQATLAIEVMADAYGRCAGQPIVLEDQSV